MAHLAAKVLEADFIVIRRGPLTLRNRLCSILPRKGQSVCGLLICPQPADLASVLMLEDLHKRYRRLAAWVFDSFWTDYIPRFMKWSKVFDIIFVTEMEDIPLWSKMVRPPVSWLPWGSDVLGLGSANAMRSTDLLRFGRQPPEWDDDTSIANTCALIGLRFHGRPPFFTDELEGERALMGLLRTTKFTLSFSNRVSPSVQTHPRREYITGRWTDALSAGAIVAGVPPKNESAREVLWDGALLDLGTTDRRQGIRLVADAVAHWTPIRAEQNYVRSLESLDWRWRFQRLAAELGVSSVTLDSEIKRMHQMIKERRPGTV